MRYRFQSRDQVYEVAIERRGDSYRALVGGKAYEFEVLDAQPGQLSLRFVSAGSPEQPERPLTLYWASEAGVKWISLNGCTYRLEKPSPRLARHTGEVDGSEAVRAPMPAQVRAVQVAEGEAVEQGQTLLLLEAMKMEIRIKAPAPGRINRLLVKAGQAVDKDQVLVEIGE